MGSHSGLSRSTTAETSRGPLVFLNPSTADSFNGDQAKLPLQAALASLHKVKLLANIKLIELCKMP